MASKSYSQQTKTQVKPASNVNFECDKDATNIITFTFSSFDKPLSFNLDDFSSIASLKYSENYVSLPPKKTVRARSDLAITLQSKSNKPVAESQHAKESVATADATKNIEASESTLQGLPTKLPAHERSDTMMPELHSNLKILCTDDEIIFCVSGEVKDDGYQLLEESILCVCISIRPVVLQYEFGVALWQKAVIREDESSKSEPSLRCTTAWVAQTTLRHLGSKETDWDFLLWRCNLLCELWRKRGYCGGKCSSSIKKVEHTLADLYELVELVRQLVHIVDSVAPHVNAAT
ncbi:hypothetical protein Tco_1349979 [Tanacetum coccineum]